MNKKPRLFSLLVAVSFFLSWGPTPVAAFVRVAPPVLGARTMPIIGGHAGPIAPIVPSLGAAPIAPAVGVTAAPVLAPAAAVAAPTAASDRLALESVSGLSERLEALQTPQGFDVTAGRSALESFWGAQSISAPLAPTSEELPVKEWDKPMSLTKDLPDMIKSVS